MTPIFIVNANCWISHYFTDESDAFAKVFNLLEDEIFAGASIHKTTNKGVVDSISDKPYMKWDVHGKLVVKNWVTLEV